MRILSTRRSNPVSSGSANSRSTNTTVSSQSSPPEEKRPAWRAITLNEAMVEIPESLLELSALTNAAPRTAMVMQAGVSGLAALRAAQCFHDAESLEEVLEGVSSASLAVAGAATLLPGQAATMSNTGFLLAHGASELLLGVREVSEELSKEKPAKLELAAGVLDSIKGASTFLPLIAPSTSTAVNLFQIGAIVTKTVMEPHMERSRKAEEARTIAYRTPPHAT